QARQFVDARSIIPDRCLRHIAELPAVRCLELAALGLADALQLELLIKLVDTDSAQATLLSGFADIDEGLVVLDPQAGAKLLRHHLALCGKAHLTCRLVGYWGQHLADQKSRQHEWETDLRQGPQEVRRRCAG